MRWRHLGPALAVLLAVAAGFALSRPDDEAPTTTTTTLAPEAVTSDAPRVASLGELAASADLVVRGEVIATERGRVFGEPGAGAAVESRLVTLRVDDVLAGAPPPGSSVLVEEEGWLEDGTPLVVDGAAASEVGDDGIWFLTDVGSADAPVFVVVSAQGRYLVDGDGLRGAELDDALVTELTGLSVDELTDRIRALPRSAG